MITPFPYSTIGCETLEYSEAYEMCETSEYAIMSEKGGRC